MLSWTIYRSSRPEVFLRKVLLKIYSKFIGEHPCRSMISIKLLCFATLLKSQFGMGVLLQMCSIFSDHLFLRTPLDGCFWIYEHFQKSTRKAATGGFLLKKLFLKIPQNSQENICVRVSFLIKLRVLTCNFIKKEALAQVLSREFCEI